MGAGATLAPSFRCRHLAAFGHLQVAHCQLCLGASLLKYDHVGGGYVLWASVCGSYSFAIFIVFGMCSKRSPTLKVESPQDLRVRNARYSCSLASLVEPLICSRFGAQALGFHGRPPCLSNVSRTAAKWS